MVDKLNKQPTHVECKQIEMIVCSTVQRVQSYKDEISSIDGKYEMTTQVNKVDKCVLLTVPNPKYEDLINKYHHQGLVMDDNDKKSELLIQDM